MSKITVKVVRVPGTITEIMLDEGQTINSALQVSNTSVSSSETVQLNGATVSLDTEVKDGDRIIVAKSAKGA